MFSHGREMYQADLLGIRLAPMVGPRIVCLQTSACFPGFPERLPASLGLGAREVHAVDVGVQGQMFTRPGDCMVLRWDAPYSDDSMNHALEINARLWRCQMGIEIAEPDCGRFEKVEAQGSLLDTAYDLYDHGAGALIASYLNPRTARRLLPNDSEFARIAESHEFLNLKGHCVDLLARQGVSTPQSISFRLADRELPWLDRLDRHSSTRYVVKVDGACGGAGIFTNHDRGFKQQQLPRVIDRLAADGLNASVQVQQFIPGTSLGAVALFEADGSFRILSLHQQKTRSGKIAKLTWTFEMQTQFAASASKAFEALADANELRLLGPVGLDFQVAGNQLFAIEANARLCGSAPLYYVRELLGIGSSVQRISIINDVVVPPSLLEGDRLATVIGRARHTQPRARILFQGINPFGCSKMLMINDDEQSTAERHMLAELKMLGN